MLEKKNVDAVNSSASAVSKAVQQCQNPTMELFPREKSNLITHLIEDFIKKVHHKNGSATWNV